MARMVELAGTREALAFDDVLLTPGYSTVLPGVAAYLASDRRLAFNTDGIFRHYPELDAA
jgi:hypothetical protein